MSMHTTRENYEDDRAKAGEKVEELDGVGQLAALIRHEMRVQGLGQTQLAALARWHRGQVARVLRRPHSAKASEIVTICAALGLDRPRAVCAIEAVGEWEAYYDPAVRLGVDMLAIVVAKINERRTCEIEMLTPSAIEVLTDWIAHTIIENQEQIRSRRDGLPTLPGLS